MRRRPYSRGLLRDCKIFVNLRLKLYQAYPRRPRPHPRHRRRQRRAARPRGGPRRQGRCRDGRVEIRPHRHVGNRQHSHLGRLLQGQNLPPWEHLPTYLNKILISSTNIVEQTVVLLAICLSLSGLSLRELDRTF